MSPGAARAGVLRPGIAAVMELGAAVAILVNVEAGPQFLGEVAVRHHCTLATRKMAALVWAGSWGEAAISRAGSRSVRRLPAVAATALDWNHGHYAITARARKIRVSTD
jgi:hypothetical protein